MAFGNTNRTFLQYQPPLSAHQTTSTMFVDHNMPYASSQSSGGSRNYSFSSDSSVYTPETRRQSFDSDMEEGQFIDYSSIQNSSFSAPGMANDDLSTLPNMLYQMEFNKVQADPGLFNFDSSFMNTQFSGHGLQIPTTLPSLVPDLQSPMSELGSAHGDFINPTQTFLDGYGTPPSSLGIHYERSPASDYAQSESQSSSYMSFSEDMNSSTNSPYSTTPSRSSLLRQPIFEPLETSVALHRIQSGSDERRAQRKIRRQANIFGNGTVRFHEAARKECSYQGCGKKFRRPEHLKRHQRTHESKECFTCTFCYKGFGRSDNLKQHVSLHADPNKKSARTKYFPEAMAYYEQLNKKTKGTTLEDKITNIKLEPGRSPKSMRSHM